MMTLNPIQRIANNALKHSRAISVCRRAKRRAKSGKDFKFWHDWEKHLQEKMIGCAEMIERVRRITRG